MEEFIYKADYRELIYYLSKYTVAMNRAHFSKYIGMKLKDNDVIILQKKTSMLQHILFPQFRGKIYSTGNETRIVGRFVFSLLSEMLLALYLFLILSVFLSIYVFPKSAHIAITVLLCMLFFAPVITYCINIGRKAEEREIFKLLRQLEEEIAEA